jgi:hypothetical protein
VVDQIEVLSAEPIEAPRDERVAGAEVVEAGLELGATADRPRAYFLVDELAPGLLERVELQRKVLTAGGDSRVADQRLVVAHGSAILCDAMASVAVSTTLLSAPSGPGTPGTPRFPDKLKAADGYAAPDRWGA